jgi:segregation and condensation protein A
LESFEGPLDLLLFLIRKNEVDIYNIPIAVITQQFLEYLEIIQLLDLETASDFILMAATLMRIKAQMLLPKPVLEESQEELEDPRQELVFRLLEYKRFKDIAVDLAEKETEARKLFPRGRFLLEREEMEEELLQDSDVTHFDLIGAFRKLLEQSKCDAGRTDRIHQNGDGRREGIEIFPII